MVHYYKPTKGNKRNPVIHIFQVLGVQVILQHLALTLSSFQNPSGMQTSAFGGVLHRYMYHSTCS